MEYKLFLDTNALLNLQKEAFKESFVISQKTLEEIENIKESSRKDNEVKYKARQVAHLLDEHFGEYEVVTNNDDVKDIISEFSLEETQTILYWHQHIYIIKTTLLLLYALMILIVSLFQRIFSNLQQKV